MSLAHNETHISAKQLNCSKSLQNNTDDVINSDHSYDHFNVQ